MRILMTWEQGGGWGHIARFAPVARALRRRGHDVVLAVRDPERTAPQVDGAAVLPLPASAASPDPPLAGSATFADVLYSIGWHCDGEIERLVEAWCACIDRERPELIVMDYSPTVLLASQARPVRRVLLSTGFTSPPDVSPLPSLLPAEDPGALEASAMRETELLERVNRILAARAAGPLGRLSQLFARVDEDILCTWPELDHYGARSRARYSGVWADTLGVRPEWPRGKGPGVFVYVKPFPALPALLTMLRESGLPVLAYLSGVAEELRRSYDGGPMRIVDRPVDLAWASQRCEIAVLNAGHGATALMLLAGAAILQIPLQLEQFQIARRVTRLGAGQMASHDSPEQIALGLRRLLTDMRFTREAKAFRMRHSRFDPERRIEEVADRIAGRE